VKRRPKSIQVTKVQKNDLVEDFLRLKENNNEKLAIHLAIKNFYQKFHLAEFEAHEKSDSWKTAKISGVYLRKWVGFYFQEIKKREKLEIEKLEREKIKTEVEIQQERELKEKQLQDKLLKEEELKEFMAKPTVILEITPDEKEQIILRLGWIIKISFFLCFYFNWSSNYALLISDG
jgi:hypothetical protein